MNGTDGTDREELLICKEVTKIFGGPENPVEAVRLVSLAISRGEFVCIMGPSGAGKSTLLHTLGGLESPTGGEVVALGQSLYELEGDDLTIFRRDHYGYVFQFFSLIDELNVRENIELPGVLARIGERAARADELIRIVGLDGKESRLPHQLSGGEQQACAIARALILEPAILLADEPTGNLDSHTTASILSTVRNIQQRLKQTIVLVSHDPKVAASGDRVVCLRDGRLEGELVFNHLSDDKRRLEALGEYLLKLERQRGGS